MSALSLKAVINGAVITVITALGVFTRGSRTFAPRAKKRSKVASRDHPIKIKVPTLNDRGRRATDSPEHDPEIAPIDETIAIEVVFTDETACFRLERQHRSIRRDRASHSPNLLVGEAGHARLPGVVHEV